MRAVVGTAVDAKTVRIMVIAERTSSIGRADVPGWGSASDRGSTPRFLLLEHLCRHAIGFGAQLSAR